MVNFWLSITNWNVYTLKPFFVDVDVVVHHTIKRNALRMALCIVSINIRNWDVKNMMNIFLLICSASNSTCDLLIMMCDFIYYDYSYFHNFLCFTPTKNKFYIKESSQAFVFGFWNQHNIYRAWRIQGTTTKYHQKFIINEALKNNNI